jgi:membrane-associated phospholipid phosphatase
VRRAVALLILIASTAHAEPWYRDRHRLLHVSLTLAGGVFYAASETVFKSDLAPTTCGWCVPPGFDASVRGALKWHDTARADTISSVTGFVITPTLELGMVALTSLELPDRSWARMIDDTIPILETVVFAETVDQITKFSVARARPFVHFTNAPFQYDNNVSFFSGHTTLVFAVTVSAGFVAHTRHYAVEPYIWATGFTLAATTGYLRMAADKHYLSDVLVGAAFGTGAGLAIPYLTMNRLTVMPTPNGIALAGGW